MVRLGSGTFEITNRAESQSRVVILNHRYVDATCIRARSRTSPDLLVGKR